MQKQITYRGLPPSDALNELVRRKIAKLCTFSDRVTGCQVVIEAPHRHQHKGWSYHVRVRLTVDGQELVAGHHVAHQSEQDAYVAVREAFHAASRQLKAFGRRRPQARARQRHAPVGRVAQLLAS